MSERHDDGLPVRDPPASPPQTDHDVAAVLLAAGESSRFDNGNKLLADFNGEPVVRAAARSLGATNLAPRVAVLGSDANAVEAVLDEFGFKFVYNPNFASGQATSVQAGVGALDAVDAVVVALGDMPAVDPSSITALVDAYRAGAGSPLAAAFEGQRGNPVLFDRSYFGALTAVTGDTGGRQLLLEHGTLVETGDPGVLSDIDTQADLEALLSG